MNEPLWQPSPDRVAQANLTEFMNHVRTRFGVQARTYAALYAWSIAKPEQFWQAVWSYCRVIAGPIGDNVVVNQHLMPGANLFPEARLNFSENLLRLRDSATAIVFLG